jgi:hypothetical protein
MHAPEHGIIDFLVHAGTKTRFLTKRGINRGFRALACSLFSHWKEEQKMK